MKIILIATVLLGGKNCIAQNIYKHYDKTYNLIMFDSCKFLPAILEDGSHRLIFRDNDDFSAYFLENIEEDTLKKVQGIIGIQVLISPEGKTCCKSIYKIAGSISLAEIDALKLDVIINNMPDWKIKNSAGPGKNYSVRLHVQFYKSNDINVSIDTAKMQFIKN